ncbi:DNA polymerase III subunit epsilon [Anabrus simplex]|uniref:DNA polymerase III subunit epsilon n=1 Tax=Anabrus simplex TaxID=316456 RepID=UPI0035A37F56
MQRESPSGERYFHLRWKRARRNKFPVSSYRLESGEKTDMEFPLTSGNLQGGDHDSDCAMVYFDLETTGLGNSAEICQIGAYYAEKDFSRYVCPKRDFDSGAAETTGFYKKDGILYLRGERVQTVPIFEAWLHFLEFLESASRSVVLVIHNRPFDSRFLLRDLLTFELIDNFRRLCIGMIDTLPLCREIFPERKQVGKRYKLQELVGDILGKEHASGSHNAVVDVRNLEKLLKQANVELEILKKHYLPLSKLEYSYFKRKKENFLKYKLPNLPRDITKKIIVADEISYEDLVRAYAEGRETGVKLLLPDEKKIRKPRVSKKQSAVEDITDSLTGLKISS